MLNELEGLKYDFSPEVRARKLELLGSLETMRLPTAEEVYDLHELAGFMRAFPESAEILEIAERISRHFDERADLGRFRRGLADTGIAGTALHFQFFWLTAIFLAERWAGSLTVEWEEFEKADELIGLLPQLIPYTESIALDSIELEPRDWIDSLRGPEETDAAFLITRFDALRVPLLMREKLFDELEMPLLLESGPDTPARGRERWDASPIVFRDAPPSRVRPRLKRDIPRVEFSVEDVSSRSGRRLIDLANSCMVPRHRDLLVFLGADPRDVRMIDFGDGLQLACMGARPERRLMLESVYGFLTLMNGVPIGYVLCSAFFNSAEVAYNVFETYRGAGAAEVYGRILGAVSQLFDADSIAVDPYQMGHGNREGQESGAWWFYYKLGFRPHDADIKALVREELARMKDDPGYRTSPARIHELASEYMFLHLDGRRDDVLGHISLGSIGLHVSAYLGGRFGADREHGLDVCAREAAILLELGRRTALTPGQRVVWRRWAPLVLTLAGVTRWTSELRVALRDIILAKGGRREADFVPLFDRHRRLREALLELARAEP